jgi:hypothetical protein
MVATRIAIGILVGVIAPGATAAYASPSLGSAVPPASYGNGNGKGAAHHQAQSASTVSAASLQQPAPQTSTSRAKGSGGVHAASLRPETGSGAVTIPGNCQSPQCQTVEATLDSAAGPPPAPSAQPPAPPSTTAPVATVPAPASPRVLASSHHPTANRTGVHRAGTPGASPSPPPTHVPSVLEEPLQLATGGWQGVSLRAATNLRVPILFGAAVLLFVLLQALVDRRDPKMSRAPERGHDDSVGFS